MNENQICEDYRRSGDVKIVAQLNDIPRKQAIEVLRRHRYIAQPVAKKSYKQRREEATARAKIRAQKEAAQDQIIKTMVESGCSCSQIGEAIGLTKQSAYYRKMRIYEPEKYAEHKHKTYENKKRRPVSASH